MIVRQTGRVEECETGTVTITEQACSASARSTFIVWPCVSLCRDPTITWRNLAVPVERLVTLVNVAPGTREIIEGGTLPFLKVLAERADTNLVTSQPRLPSQAVT